MHVTDRVTPAPRKRMNFCPMFNVERCPGTQSAFIGQHGSAGHDAGQNAACHRKPLSAILPSGREMALWDRGMPIVCPWQSACHLSPTVMSAAPARRR